MFLTDLYTYIYSRNENSLINNSRITRTSEYMCEYLGVKNLKLINVGYNILEIMASEQDFMLLYIKWSDLIASFKNANINSKL